MKYKGLEVDPSKIHESIVVQPQLSSTDVSSLMEQAMNNQTFLLPRIEAIHEGTTRNFTRYPADKLRGDQSLKSGVYSWTHPYPKPVIYNHDVETEATGRVHSAYFTEFTAAGKPGIVVVPKITSPKAIQDILEGRLLTVSIGATTDAAICSICGTDIIQEGFCGHMKGEEYDGQKAEWIVGNLWFDELSWVNVPADQHAMIVDAGVMQMTVDATSAEHMVASTIYRPTITVTSPTSSLITVSSSATGSGYIISTNGPVSGQGQLESTEKGEAPVNEEQVKELQEKLEAAEAKITSLEEQNTALTSEVESLKTEKESLEAKVTSLEEQIASLETQVQEKEEALSQLTATKEDLETKVAQLESLLEEEKQAREQMVEENTKLVADMHQQLAERVVDLRLFLGKESDREQALQKYSTRTTESLRDSLQDLLAESAQMKPIRTVERIENPVHDIVPTVTNQTTEGLTKEEVLKNLFSGPAFLRK